VEDLFKNVSTELLDRWFGARLPAISAPGEEKFHAIVSAAAEDEHHPRRAVARGFIHRGAKLVATKGSAIRTSENAPNRDGWSAAKPLDYPEDQES
jgi:hypothetical protein